MKLKSLSFVIGAISAASVSLSSHAQSGGPFDLSWSTVDNGGGGGSGGQFALTGTIGQADAGVLTGGNFKLEGGLWNALTVLQTPGAPILKITLIGGGQAIISWPLSAQGFTLEETANSAPPNSWSATPQAVVNTATEQTVTVPAAGLIKCYRLKK